MSVSSDSRPIKVCVIGAGSTYTPELVEGLINEWPALRVEELVFVENHDTERNGSTLSYKDGALNALATEFMLARGHGRPQVYAGFNFSGSDDSPPSGPNGIVTDTDCNNGWTCTDRFMGVANMVGWHNFVGDAPLANWYDDAVKNPNNFIEAGRNVL